MNIQEFVTIIIRLVALVLLIISVHTVNSTLIFLFQSNSFVIESVLAIIIPLAVAVFLWLASAKIAAWITANNSRNLGETGFNQSILSPLIITLGLYFLIDAILKLIQWFFNAWVFKANSEFTAAIDTVQIQTVFITNIVVQILVALILVFKNQWLSHKLFNNR